jgi:hypothetical protein
LSLPVSAPIAYTWVGDDAWDVSYTGDYAVQEFPFQ